MTSVFQLFQTKIYKIKRTGALSIKEYQKINKHDGYGVLFGGFIQSNFQEFESYLRSEIVLAEDDIELILKQNLSNFLTYELHPGVYTIRDFMEHIDE